MLGVRVVLLVFCRFELFKGGSLIIIFEEWHVGVGGNVWKFWVLVLQVGVLGVFGWDVFVVLCCLHYGFVWRISFVFEVWFVLSVLLIFSFFWVLQLCVVVYFLVLSAF